MTSDAVRRSAAVVGIAAALAAGCGSDEDPEADRTSTLPSAGQELDALRERCLAQARALPDARSRQHASAACSQAAADAPTGPGAPAGEDLKSANRAACEQTAAAESDAAIRKKIEQSCKAIE